MKVYLEPEAGLSRAMTRVARALAQYAPSRIQPTFRESNADLVVLHTIGYDGVCEKIERLCGQGKKYSIIQYCVRSTQRARTHAWLPLWRDAVSVWSYYDLPRLAREDHGHLFDWDKEGINFYYAPLGVDANVFKPSGLNGKSFIIVTSGYVAQSEGVAECAVAANLVGGRQFHLGPEMDLGFHISYALNITDQELARRYSQSQFVAGLRRREGFELPAAEGLLCGARPIVFDAPHYRAWYDELAEFIPEGSFDDTVEALKNLFAKGAKPVSREERELGMTRFNWESIANGFWQTI